MSRKKARSKMNTEIPTEIPAEVSNFALKSVDQAQAAFDKVNEVAHSNVQMLDAATSTYKNRVTDIQLKSMEFAQSNVNAGFSFFRKLFAVKQPAEAFTLQQAFMKEQAEVLQRQAAELSELSVSLAKESLKPVQEQMNKTLSGFNKNIAA
jgi:phasin